MLKIACSHIKQISLYSSLYGRHYFKCLTPTSLKFYFKYITKKGLNKAFNLISLSITGQLKKSSLQQRPSRHCSVPFSAVAHFWKRSIWKLAGSTISQSHSIKRMKCSLALRDPLGSWKKTSSKVPVLLTRKIINTSDTSFINLHARRYYQDADIYSNIQA